MENKNFSQHKSCPEFGNKPSAALQSAYCTVLVISRPWTPFLVKKSLSYFSPQGSHMRLGTSSINPPKIRICYIFLLFSLLFFWVIGPYFLWGSKDQQHSDSFLTLKLVLPVTAQVFGILVDWIIVVALRIHVSITSLLCRLGDFVSKSKLNTCAELTN